MRIGGWPFLGDPEKIYYGLDYGVVSIRLRYYVYHIPDNEYNEGHLIRLLVIYGRDDASPVSPSVISAYGAREGEALRAYARGGGDASPCNSSEPL